MKGENYMDQEKIGRFIQEKRKEQNLTQSDLAERLNITDRSVSKWEKRRNTNIVIFELCRFFKSCPIKIIRIKKWKQFVV